MKLQKSDVEISSRYRTDRAYVVGSMFGPMLLVVGGTFEEALEAFTVRYCDAPKTFTEKDLDDGDVRWTDDGPRIIDHYEWVREFTGKDAVRRAGRFFRTGDS